MLTKIAARRKHTHTHKAWTHTTQQTEHNAQHKATKHNTQRNTQQHKATERQNITTTRHDAIQCNTERQDITTTRHDAIQCNTKSRGSAAEAVACKSGRSLALASEGPCEIAQRSMGPSLGTPGTEDQAPAGNSRGGPPLPPTLTVLFGFGACVLVDLLHVQNH